MEKYKVKAWKHSENKWEAQYINPAQIGELGILETGKPDKLGKFFESENQANEYTKDYLIHGLGIRENNITILE